MKKLSFVSDCPLRNYTHTKQRSDELPSQKARGSDPRDSCQNQPDNAYQYSAVIDLADAGNQKT